MLAPSSLVSALSVSFLFFPIPHCNDKLCVVCSKFAASVVSTLLNFARMFNQAHQENCKQLELETKKAVESEKLKIVASHKQSEEYVNA